MGRAAAPGAAHPPAGSPHLPHSLPWALPKDKSVWGRCVTCSSNTAGSGQHPLSHPWSQSEADFKSKSLLYKRRSDVLAKRFLAWMERKCIPGSIWFPSATEMALWTGDECPRTGQCSTTLAGLLALPGLAAAEIPAGKNVRGQESSALVF